jgi:hypothetical protein
MTSSDTIEQWLNIHTLLPIHIDCVTAVMLKILDGKCKMNREEKTLMTLLYEQVKHCQGALLPDDIHDLIAISKMHPEDDNLRMLVYEKRLLAETMISRPVMKAFKSMIREQGLLVKNQ